jgi:L-ascorbate metabolism protein UlaG (beta-lactamase superfamily)
VFAYVVPLKDAQHPWPHTLMYRFEIEGMSVGFLGGADRTLTDEELGKLQDIDILLLPVGGDDRLNAKQAIETISAIEPRVVVPLYHHIEGVQRALGTADAFCKELGVCQRQDANRLKITKKDLPSEDLLVAVLEKV